MTYVPFQPVSWRELVAVGVVANDLTSRTIARCAGVSLGEAESALQAAHDGGIVCNGAISAVDAVTLVAELPPTVIAQVHLIVARFLLSEGPSRVLEAISHARSAGTLFPTSELAAIADKAASTSLSVGDYDSARRFLEFAHDFGVADTPEQRARRLCQLGFALEGLGLVNEARERLAAAFDLAEMSGNAEIAVEAAVNYVLPVDWYAGDRHATALLQRAEQLLETHEQRVTVQAARAMAEMRIPISAANTPQVAWVTRPTVAQPLSEVALEGSENCSDTTRLLALLAWRTTHRDPVFIEERRIASAHAFDLAQRLRLPNRQVDAAVMLAVDALQSADRPGYDHALTVLRWVAEVDGNPRLAWHAHAAAAGAAHLEGDIETATHHRNMAREVGIAINSPGWLSADLLLFGQELLERRDPEEMLAHLPDEASTELLNPLGKLIVGLGRSLTGDDESAERLLRRAMRQFEREASWLLCLTRSVELAVRLASDDIVDELWRLLSPWSDHVAVDSQAWFCDGPVSGWLALLANKRCDVALTRRYVNEAEAVARRLGDARTMTRMATLRSSLGSKDQGRTNRIGMLTEREMNVLQLVVDGLSNPQIAETLSYSPSTVRNDLTAIYRKFGVATRAEAAAIAIREGHAHRDQRPGLLMS